MKKISKIISTILSILGTIIAIIILCNYCIPIIKSYFNKPDLPDFSENVATQLATPKNLNYNNQTYILSWVGDENASGYTINYNGYEFQVDANDTQELVQINATNNTFKVKAVGDGEKYKDSNWSNECVYTIEQQQEQQLSLYDKVNIALGEAAKKRDLEHIKVVGISYANVEGNASGEKVIFECVCKDDGVIKNYSFGLYSENGDSIENMLANIEVSDLKQANLDNTVDYQSVKYLLESKSFDGEMQKLNEAGYTITEICSCVREGNKSGNYFYFEIVGTYKAVLGNNVKYFTSVNYVQVINPSSEERLNYQNCCKGVEKRNLTEKSFIDHGASGTLCYMEDLIKAIENANTTT